MPKKIQNVIPETIVVGDTSALVSLGVGSVLEKSLLISRIVIPPTVKNEIEEMSSFDDNDGITARKILGLTSQNKIDVLEIKEKEDVKRLVISNSRIDPGEAEALILAEEQSIPILLTDDFRSIPQLKRASKRVEIHLSIYLIARLVLEEIINKEQAVEALNNIAKDRTWLGGAIYHFAMKYIEKL